jgi:hypothetical protein
VTLKVSAVCDEILRESTSALIGKILDFGLQRTRDDQRCRCCQEACPCGKEDFALHEENVR